MINNKLKNIGTMVYFGFYSLGLIILIFIFYSKLLPDYNNIKLLKSEAYNNYNNIKEIEIKGVSFGDFNNNLPIEILSKSLYLNNLVRKISPDFYDNIFVNESELDYEKHLDNLKEKYSKDLDYDEVSSLISKILPVYSNLDASIIKSNEELLNYFNNNSVMSDFHFLNYLDILFDSFRMKYNNSIGISELIFLEDYSFGELSSIDSDIYYIPISLDVEVRKDYFLDFLHFIENVGTVLFDGEEIIFKEIGNSELSTIRNSLFFSKNIYNNILSDISVLELPEYLDSINVNYNENNFIDYVKRTQGNQVIEASLEIKFYVKGLPSYLLEGSLENFLDKFSSIRSVLDEKLSDENLSDDYIVLLNDINNKITEIEFDLVDRIIESFTDKSTLELIYIEAYNYNSILDEFLEIVNN